MDLVLHPARRVVTTVVLLALVLASVVLVTPAVAATPDAVALDTACAGTTSAGFTDTEGTTFEFEIDCFASRGFTQGTGNGSTYEPFNDSTRWQMATFLHRVLRSVDDSSETFDLPEPEDQGFTDIDDLDQEFQDAINVLAALNIAEGTTPTTFEPLSNLRRDQMASFINRAQGAIQAADGGDAAGFTTEDDYFPDTDGNLHDDNIDGIASEGIVQGRTDGNYYPADPVNRGQMSAFIMRWVQVLEDSGLAEGESEEGDDSGDVSDVSVVDTNASGLLDVGDLLAIEFDAALDDLVGDGGDDALTLLDGDGTLLTLHCGDDRCVQSDTGLLGEPVLGDEGLLVIGVGDENLVEVETGDVDGLDVDGEVTDVSEGFLSEDGTPLQVGEGDGALGVIDPGDLDNDALQGIVDLIDGLLGDLLDQSALGEDGILGIDDLLGGGLFGGGLLG